MSLHDELLDAIRYADCPHAVPIDGIPCPDCIATAVLRFLATSTTAITLVAAHLWEEFGEDYEGPSSDLLVTAAGMLAALAALVAEEHDRRTDPAREPF